MAKKNKGTKKKRANKYEAKLAVKSTLDQVLKASIPKK